jgi:hypothetical protein
VPRRDLVLLGVLAAVVLALAILAGAGERGEGGDDPRPSTFLTSPDGAQALYWLLEELDLPVGRTLQPLVEGDPPRGALALLAPTRDLSPAEVHEVMERVREGDLLLFAAAPWGRGPIHDSLGVLPRFAPGQHVLAEGAAARARPHGWTEGVDTVSGFRAVFADTSPAFLRPGIDTLLVREGRAVAVTFPLGEGRVVALADVHPLTNARLRESGAAVLVARAAAAAGDTLWFDEYYHGFREPEGGIGALRRLMAVVPAGAWLQLLLLGVLALWAAGRRFGAPYPPAPRERRSPLEHVEALAGAYRQADARRTARHLLVAGLARRLGRRVPPDDRAAAEMLKRMARGSPATAPAAAELQREWERGREADLAALSRAVDRILEEVRR